jgi:hypothetical protein
MNRIKMYNAIAASLLISVLHTGAAMAASGGFGAIARTVTTEIIPVAGLVEMGAYFFGVVFVVTSLLKFKQLADQPGQPKAGAAWTFVIGICLLGLGFIISAGSGSMGGTPTGMDRLGIGR